ncbi:Transcription elongation factor, mitochondrial [Anthophora quadrimaculata]
MLKTLRTFVNLSRTRKDVWIKPVQWYSTRTNSIIGNNYKKIFSIKQDHILNILNTSSLNILTRYIQEPYAEKIIQHRTENGPFKSLNELTKIQDIELDALNSLWISPTDEMMLSKLKRSIMMPKTKITAVPNEVLGLHIGTNVVSWAMVTSDFKILYLDFIDWSESTKGTNIYELIDLAQIIAKELPPSCSYVIEEFPYTNKLSNIYLTQQKLMTAILSCVKVLNEQTKASSSLEDDFYMLRKQTSAQFFNLVIGKETIASRYIIGKILYDSTIETKPFEDIYINSKLRSKFINITSEQQEQIGWSLLKAITCMYLIKFCKENKK